MPNSVMHERVNLASGSTASTHSSQSNIQQYSTPIMESQPCNTLGSMPFHNGRGSGGSSSAYNETRRLDPSIRSGNSRDPSNVRRRRVYTNQSAQPIPRVQQISIGSSFIRLRVGQTVVNARLDTGAEATVLSSKVYNSLKNKPAKLENCKMRLAGNNSMLNGFLIEPISMQIGSYQFAEQVYVAPIHDEMLLGHDILQHMGAILDLRDNALVINGERVPVTTEISKGQKPTIARVTLSQKVVVPPNSVMRVSCSISEPLEEYIVESVNEGGELLIPRTLQSKTARPVVCIVNPTSQFKKLPKGKNIASACEIGQILESNEGLDFYPQTGSSASYALAGETGNTTAEETKHPINNSLEPSDPTTSVYALVGAVGGNTEVKASEFNAQNPSRALSIPSQVYALVGTNREKTELDLGSPICPSLRDQNDTSAVDTLADADSSRLVLNHSGTYPEQDILVNRSLSNGVCIQCATLKQGGTVPKTSIFHNNDTLERLPVLKGPRTSRTFSIRGRSVLESENPNCDSLDTQLKNLNHCCLCGVYLGDSTVNSSEFRVNSVTEQQSLHDAKSWENADSILSKIPDHVKSVFETSKQNLTASQQCHLAQILIEFQDVFAKNEYDLGDFDAIEHGIDTGQAQPIKLRMRRTPACFVEEEEAHLNKMLKAGVIQESTSDWAAAPVLIRKRDGSVRWCIDYRALNNVTVKDTYPLPLMEDCLDTLSGKTWFSKLDANSAYWQIKVKKEDRKKTAFITKYGLFEHVRMGFGLTNAPATYSRVVNLLMRGLTWKTVLAFLDDILVMGESFDSHIINLKEALGRFRLYKIKLKPKKCLFFQTEIEFLGRIVSQNSIKMNPRDINTVISWPKPSNTKELEKFLGLVNYHRGFIKNFAELSQPLYKLTGKRPFIWGPDQTRAFEALKRALTTPPVLALPNNSDPFILDTDASENAIGAELLQVQNGEEKVIAYGSYVLTPEQRNYCTTRKELLSIVRFTRQFKYYLLGRDFTVRTDHSSLTWLLRFKEPQGQLARWIEELSQYHMIVQHRPGVKHQNADALSRRPDNLTPCSAYVAGIKPEDLPCGGCHYCTRAHTSWGSFFTDVDEAVGLARTKDTNTTRVKQLNSVAHLSHTQTGLDTLDTSLNKMENFQLCFSILDTLVAFSVGENSTDPQLSRIEIVRNGNEIGINTCGTPLSYPKVDSRIPCCWGFSIQYLKTEQENDVELNFLREWLLSGEIPDEGLLFRSSPITKNYWMNKELFRLVQGVIFFKDPKDQELKLVIPESLKGKILELHHDIPSSGHQGVARTKLKIKEKFFWYHLSKDVTSFVLSCDVCNRNKRKGCYGRVPMTEYQSSSPMERVHIDFMGPLPRTTQGNEHCLVMVDQFTKWVECVPLPSQKAEVTAKAAIDSFFSRFGYPLQIFSDQGRNFESTLFTALCRALHIHKARTTPYRPSANGQVERYNRTIMEAVRCFVGKQQHEWDRYIQQIAGALRSSVNRDTGFTPNMLMLGREVNTPAQLMFPIITSTAQDYGEYVSKFILKTQQAHQIARDRLKTTTKRMKRDYDLKILLRPYAEKDLVYIMDTAIWQLAGT
ncbi:uncharacterized protein LOC106152279 [Lingula anatina]|uniref:RNA-directed DNA polymerase n=1 Tax=Lingula anatina TaxID=7574 RepID=A0A1S3H6Z9_LINAN|nr:uncharacterized protein LOC106152279 [Lingula anatina]|eukprot:XP_013381256.1 uncharacterized protein LOC106152279 [Lingula anatina]